MHKTDHEPVVSPSAEITPRARGRPRQSVSSQVLAATRLERLEAELKAAKAAERAARERQARIVGGAAIAALRKHPEPAFRRQLLAWLRLTVTKPVDRTEIAPLLIEGEPT